MNRPSRKFVLALATALGVGVLAPIVQAESQAVHSLRGADVAAPEPAPDNFRPIPDQTPIQRDYVQQPPLIPHKVDGYQVTVKFNKCMDCHAWSRYRETGATKVSLTHFKDREGGELSNVSPRRYFCMQCHVPQTDAKPLVGNRFESAVGVR